MQYVFSICCSIFLSKSPLSCLLYQCKFLPVLFWPGKRGGSRSRRRAACHPRAPSSRCRLYIAAPGRPPLDKWSWWSSPSLRAPDAPPAQPAHSGTWRPIKVNEPENEMSDGDGQTRLKRSAKKMWIRRWNKWKRNYISDELIVTDKWMAEWTPALVKETGLLKECQSTRTEMNFKK